MKTSEFWQMKISDLKHFL